MTERELLVQTINDIRYEFSILATKIGRRKLVYFDNAATSQTPADILDRWHDYYSEENANIHRGVHKLSQKATEAYEESRKKLQGFINAKHDHEIIFTSGTTDGINLVARGMRSVFKKGDKILITTMEHHSNIVPWQLIAEELELEIVEVTLDDNGDIDLDVLKAALKDAKLLAVTHVSNAIGTVNPIKDIVKMAHKNDVLVLVDGAQAVPHMPVDVQDLDCDFYAFSGHKMYGPTGIGVLYGKEDILNQMSPYKGGGDMIEEVTIPKSTWNELPFKFEAGTPNIADAICLGATVDYINDLGFDTITKIEDELMSYALAKMSEVEAINIIGNPKKRAGVISFTMDKVHPHDIGTIMDSNAVAIRAGHHCAQPLMKHFGLDATARISFAAYNTFEEIDNFMKVFIKIEEMFGE